MSTYRKHSVVLKTIEKAVRQERDGRERARAGNFIGRFIDLVADYSRSLRFSHVRRAPMPSRRGAAEISAEVRQFYSRRPRPWRWSGNQARKCSR